MGQIILDPRGLVMLGGQTVVYFCDSISIYSSICHFLRVCSDWFINCAVVGLFLSEFRTPEKSWLDGL